MGSESFNVIYDCMRKKKRVAFDAEEKRYLCELVKSHPCIWDNKRFFPNHGEKLRMAWLEIAESMKKTVFQCKSAWKSLRDSRRYHTKVAKGKMTDINLWEFSKQMSFLPPCKDYETSVYTISLQGFHSSGSSDPETQDQTSPLEYEEVSCPEIETKENDCKIDKKTCEAQEQSSLCPSPQTMTNIHKYMESQMNAAPKPNLEKYAFMDSLLKKLPDEVADDLMVDFICMIREEIKRRSLEVVEC